MMKLLKYGYFIRLLLILFIPQFLTSNATAQSTVQNIFIICTDGFRWQEVYTGADSQLINSPNNVKDTGLLKEQYWAETPEQRRALLMPFFWNVIAKRGELYGNEKFDNNVSVKNIYQISYPGYSEMLSGFVDPLFIPDLPINNRNSNVLEYLNHQPGFNGKVVAFTSWNIFPYIFNKNNTSFPVNSGYAKPVSGNSDSLSAINYVEENVKQKKHTRYDLLTYMHAREYISHNHPRVVFLGFGETDDLAHGNHYDLYLQHAANIDKMISDLWYYVQTDPFYKNNTTFIITTDHGRGSSPSTWQTHNGLVKGSAQTWLALIGPNIPALGEMKSHQNIYEKQIASTIAMLLGESYDVTHRIAAPIKLPEEYIKSTGSTDVAQHKTGF